MRIALAFGLTDRGRPAAAPPTNTVAPAVSGTETEGQTLTTTDGTWTGSPSSYERKWQRNTGSWADIGGATNSTYVLAAGDVGYTVRPGVRATGPGGVSDWAYGTATGTIAALMTAPTAYWPLSNANDVCAGARNLSGTAGSFVAGKVGNCWSVATGTRTRASDASIDLPTSGTSYSVACWLYWGNSYSNPLRKNSGSTGWGWTFSSVDKLGNSNNTLHVGLLAGGTKTVYSAPYSYSTWYHVAMVIDRTADVLRLYQDAVLVDSISIAGYSSGDSSGGALTLGGATTVRLDEVGLWHGHALTGDEVSYLYNSGTGRTFDGSVWT